MSPFLLGGIICAVFCVLAYVVYAATKKVSPELKSAVEIMVSCLGVASAVKLFSFAVCGDFNNLIKLAAETAEKTSTTTLHLSEEDIIFVLIGSLALFWTCIQTVIHQFLEIKKKSDEPVAH